MSDLRDPALRLELHQERPNWVFYRKRKSAARKPHMTAKREWFDPADGRELCVKRGETGKIAKDSNASGF